MEIPEHPTLVRRMLDARVQQFVAGCAPRAASLGRQASGGWPVTLKQAGKTRTVYVPQDLKEEVEASIQELRRIQRLLREITQRQRARIRLHRTEQARRGGRP